MAVLNLIVKCRDCGISVEVKGYDGSNPIVVLCNECLAVTVKRVRDGWYNVYE